MGVLPRPRDFAIAIALMLLPAPALAIGSIVNGDVAFSYTNSFATSRNNTVDTSFTGAATGNQTYESWWFYRVSGDSRESAFGTPDSELYQGSVGFLDFDDPTSGGLFNATLGIEVFDNGTDSGNLFQGLTVRNTSGANLTIDIFHYSDLEVGGNSAADSANLGSGGSDIIIDVFDGTDTAPIVGYGADNFWVSQWGGGGSVLQNLTDNNVDNFSDQGLPFGPADFTVGFQWSRTFGPDEVHTFVTQFGSNSPLLDPSTSVVPEPNSVLMIGLGLVVLGSSRRRAA